MSFNPLISLARNSKRQRMEMQCDPQWVLDLAAERDQLRAERNDLRTTLKVVREQQAVLYVSADDLSDDKLIVVHTARTPNAVQTLRLYALPPQQPDAVSMPRELLERVAAILGSQGFSAWDELAAEVLLSTKNAEEGE